MAKYKMKPMVVEAVSFDDLIKYGLTQTDNIYNNKPWSFTYMGLPVTHETDDCYIIGDNMSITENQMLVLKGNEISIVDKDAFEIIAEPLEE